jgi:catechol 2,3-dioxygenase-like lactoylglutathione lyase family enzyme
VTGTRAITGIEHVGIQVPDLDAALAMFVDGLGLELRFRGHGPDGTTAVAFVASDGMEFEIFERGDGGPARLEHLALRTDDLAGASAEIATHGVAADGEEVQGMRGTRAILLDQATTLGIRMHLSTAGPGAAS